MANMFVSRKVSVVLLSAAAGLSCALLCAPASQATTAKKQGCNAKNHSQNFLSCYCSGQLNNDKRNDTRFTGAGNEVACSGRGSIFSLIIPVSSPVVTAPRPQAAAQTLIIASRITTGAMRVTTVTTNITNTMSTKMAMTAVIMAVGVGIKAPAMTASPETVASPTPMTTVGIPAMQTRTAAKELVAKTIISA